MVPHGSAPIPDSWEMHPAFLRSSWWDVGPTVGTPSPPPPRYSIWLREGRVCKLARWDPSVALGLELSIGKHLFLVGGLRTGTAGGRSGTAEAEADPGWRSRAKRCGKNIRQTPEFLCWVPSCPCAFQIRGLIRGILG